MITVALFKGFILGAGMIMPLGVQNSYVLSQGIKRNFHFTAASICILCDITLIALGVFGGSQLLAQQPQLITVAGWGGIIFLLSYAAIAIKNVIQNNYQQSDQVKALNTRKQIIVTTLAVTLLNPHVYLDTVMILGGVGSMYEGHSKYAFAFGTMLASLTWFMLLATTAAKMAPVLGTPKAQRIIDGIIALIMMAVAFSIFNMLLAR